MAGPLIQLTTRRDLAANWTTADPVLALGEVGVETDTGWHKIGDGATAWTALGYYHGPPWLQGVDGGLPASTFGGAPSTPYYGVMCSVDPDILPPSASTENDSNWAGLQLYGAGYDGNGTIVVGAYKNSPDFEHRVYVAGDDLTNPTVFNMTGITGWTAGSLKSFTHIQYSPKLSRWVASCGREQIFYCSGDPSVAANWTEVTYPTNHPNFGSFENIRILKWSYHMEMFICMFDGQLAESLDVSVDGINWFRWSDYQALGGSYPDRMSTWWEGTIGATPQMLGFQIEAYIQRSSTSGAGALPGAAQSWSTATSANGVIQNTSGSYIYGYASDGNVLAVSNTNQINCTDFSLSHPDAWGPSGNSNVGWSETDLGFANISGDQILNLFYLPQYSRPWKIFRHDTGGSPVNTDHGWWDATSITYPGAVARNSGNAPSFAFIGASGDEPFASLNTAYLADSQKRPANYQVGFSAQFPQMDQGDPGITGHVLGTRGYFMIMRTDVSRLNDYIIFQPP